jgi:hypothetical protein
MFRAAVLSIALTFAVGTNLPLLCEAWCDSLAVAETGCHHEKSGSSAGIGAGDHCQMGAVAAIGLREQARRRGAPDTEAVRRELFPTAALLRLELLRTARPEPHPPDQHVQAITPLRI